MALESANWISELDITNPPGTDQKKQGDDHLRLIKSVLKAVFPNASKAFYLPGITSISGPLTITAAHENKTIEVDTAAGSVAVTLPTLVAGDAGLSFEIVKTSSDANAVIVTWPSASILSRVGSTATIRVGCRYEPARFLWNGAAWICHKFGTRIGSTEEFNGPSLPPGYLWEQGSSFSGTDFAELAAVLGGTVLPDKRDRVSIGKGDMGGAAVGRIVNSQLGSINSLSLLAGGGEEMRALSQFHLPIVNFTVAASGSISGSAAVVQQDAVEGSVFPTSSGGVHSVRVNDGTQVSLFNNVGLDAPTIPAQTAAVTGTATVAGTAASGGSGVAPTKIPPAVIVNKIIRAC